LRDVLDLLFLPGELHVGFDQVISLVHQEEITDPVHPSISTPDQNLVHQEEITDPVHPSISTPDQNLVHQEEITHLVHRFIQGSN
jgi:hypothetical protein